MTYMVQGPRREHKCDLNQVRHRHTDLESPRQERPIKNYAFDIPMLQEIIKPQRYSKRKRTTTELLNVEPT